MNRLLLSLLLFGFHLSLTAQVGVGTNAAPKMLTVKGTILVDQGNSNKGSLDSAALLFGYQSTWGKVGISSPKSSALPGQNGGLLMFTNDTARLAIFQNGNVRIGDTAIASTTKLIVGGRTSIKGEIAVGEQGLFQPGNALSVNGHAYVRDNASLNGFVGIGGQPDPLLVYKLKVSGDADISGIARAGELLATSGISTTGTAYVGQTLSVIGNSFLRGNATVTGELLVDGNNGIVKSHTTEQLRMAFNSGAFSFTLNPGNFVDISFAIANFSGDNDDVRVSINQFIPAAGSPNTWHQVTMTVFSTNATSNTCQVRFYNAGSSTAAMNGTLYLCTIFKQL